MRPGTSVGVCDYDDQLRGAPRGALEREGLIVRATTSGTEAVRTFGAEPPDVLVLDIGLPDADGRDVCQALRARGMTTPVLFLTARDALPDRIARRGIRAGLHPRAGRVPQRDQARPHRAGARLIA
jgi:two-component system, OmpR family, response regulator